MNREVAIVPEGGPMAAFAKKWPDTSVKPVVLEDLIRRPTLYGYFIIIVFVIGFFVWAGLAPLAGGVIASGIVSPDGHRKSVQHLEGGIIREINIRDGDTVVTGQALIELEPVQPQTNHETLRSQHLALQAKKHRLDAETSGAARIDFPPILQREGNLIPEAESQEQIFEARRAAQQARKDVLFKKKEQLAQSIVGTEAQIASLSAQLTFVQEELKGKETLFKQGLLAKSEMLRLSRLEAELVGRRAEQNAETGKARQQIAEINLQVLSADAEWLDGAIAESEKVRQELAEITERLRSSADILKRTTILAPVNGTVLNMRFKTVGGVVQRGETVLEIVPIDDSLIIDAQVSPNDIHRVREGLIARIQFSGHSIRVMPRLNGVVRSISPDRVPDSFGQRVNFLVRVEVDREDIEKKAPSIKLMPGLAAEVILETEERTMFEYLLQPLRDALRRSLRET